MESVEILVWMEIVFVNSADESGADRVKTFVTLKTLGNMLTKLDSEFRPEVNELLRQARLLADDTDDQQNRKSAVLKRGLKSIDIMKMESLLGRPLPVECLLYLDSDR